MKDLNKTVDETVERLVNELGVNLILSIHEEEPQVLESELKNLKIFDVGVELFKKGENRFHKTTVDLTYTHRLEVSTKLLRKILSDLIRKGMISQEDTGIALFSGFKGDQTISIFIFDASKMYNINVSNTELGLKENLLETIIEIAREVVREGREGKQIGTAFVLGDSNEVAKYTKQIILNPFEGYPGERRDIFDKKLRETIKNFAQLDGLFIINENGFLVSAGTYLDVPVDAVSIEPGLGTRHAACAALSRLTKAVVVVVSASGGVIRVYYKGKIIMKLAP